MKLTTTWVENQGVPSLIAQCIAMGNRQENIADKLIDIMQERCIFGMARTPSKPSPFEDLQGSPITWEDISDIWRAHRILGDLRKNVVDIGMTSSMVKCMELGLHSIPIVSQSQYPIRSTAK